MSDFAGWISWALLFALLVWNIIDVLRFRRERKRWKNGRDHWMGSAKAWEALCKKNSNSVRDLSKDLMHESAKLTVANAELQRLRIDCQVARMKLRDMCSAPSRMWSVLDELEEKFKEQNH